MARTFDPFDELAAMFLTAPAPAPPPAGTVRGSTSAGSAVLAGRSAESNPVARASFPARRRLERSAAPAKAVIEMLIVGHLPVRGGLWLTPYADALAREFGSTALVRLDGEEASVQLLRAPIALASTRLDGPMRHAITELGGAVDVWIIRPPSACEPGDLIRAGADRMTILTSADEAAAVAAYQLIKNLAQAAEQSQQSLPPIGLAIVGADSAGAAAIIDRLNRTTISFLGVEVRLALCLPRMDAGIKSTRYISFAGQAPTALGEVMASIEQARAEGRARTVAAPVVAGRLHADRADAEVSDVERLLRSAPPMAPRPSAAPAPNPAPPYDSLLESLSGAAAASAPAQGDSSARRHALPRIKLAPKPAFHIEPKQPAAAAEPDDHGQPVPLALHVEGLTPLPVRPPGHEHVELAVDNAGRLHLLGREHTLREMPVVESWARLHRELLALACSQHHIDLAGKALCHVFSDRPLALADLHGAGLCLHVLAPVIVNGQTAWYSAPLNAAPTSAV